MQMTQDFIPRDLQSGIGGLGLASQEPDAADLWGPHPRFGGSNE